MRNGLDGLAAAHVPDPDVTVGTSGGQRASVHAHGQARDLLGVTLHDGFAGRHLVGSGETGSQQVHGEDVATRAAGKETPLRRVHGNAGQATIEDHIEQQRAGGHTPQLEHFIERDRGDAWRRAESHGEIRDGQRVAFPGVARGGAAAQGVALAQRVEQRPCVHRGVVRPSDDVAAVFSEGDDGDLGEVL